MKTARKNVVGSSLDFVQPNKLGNQLPCLENLPFVLDGVGGFILGILHLNCT